MEKEKANAEKFGLIQGEGRETPHEDVVREYNELLDEHKCGKGMSPRWCVMVRDRESGWKRETFVKPSEQDEFVAHRLAAFREKFGAEARAMRVEDAEMLEASPEEGQERTAL